MENGCGGRRDRPGSPAVILIVEDEADLADTCARYLGRLGYVMRIAHTGTDALAAITTAPPRLVIADLRLPGAVDGFAVARHARAHRPPIPVVVCSAYASDPSRREAKEIGAAEYLAKPFSLTELRGAVAHALEAGDRLGGEGPA